jgi:3-oxoacyl-[acyl-carrier-protein] synthase II
MANAAAAQIAQRLCLTGPNQTVMTACAAGAHSLGTALRLIQQGDANVVLAGGAEAPICPSALAGFHAMGALSPCSDPARASRPFDARRDGFVIAEGAGLLVLEELRHATARGARIYAEVLGYGASADAYHVCAPSPDGAGAVRAMTRALADAGVTANEIDYVSAHGTSTHYNDAVETRAIKTVLGEHAYAVPVSAAKSTLGHLIGAGAAVESILTIKTLVEGLVPPTLNQDERDPECDLDHVSGSARPTRARLALKNAFGFGGNNACLVFAGWRDELV